ncbi:glycosyltransferase [Candidatus Falkowbacteria bacterium]|nr:glycosyltransferase [Candidatus Falkowbacteria bacterium]
MRIALVHDHLTQKGGAEKVLEAMAELYPEAPIFTLVHDPATFQSANKIHTSFLQKLTRNKNKFQWLLPLMPTATEHHDLKDFDIVISSSSIFAKGIITQPNTLHICYCHTPPRFLWLDYHSYVNELKTNKLIKKILPIVLTRLRQWDRLAASRVNHFVANSHEVQRRIAHFYNRPSEVIHPPVDTGKFHISTKNDGYYLAGGRLVSYKRFDIIVTAFNRLNMKLKIFGTGPEFDKLREMAKPNIEFLGQISDKDKPNLYSHALAFINPQIEDFGITVVEAMASGRPVIALRAGGALETIIEKQTGMFFDEQCWEDLADAILRFNPENFDPQKIREHALQWDKENFKQNLQKFITEKYECRH